MKIKTLEISVGLLMIAGVLSLLMLALKVSGLTYSFEDKPGYMIRADFSNIGGLKTRARVSVAGVVIGRVLRVELDPQTFNASVWMSIDPSQAHQLPMDSRASILTAGLLGDNYVGISPGFSEQEFLAEGSHIPVSNTDSAVVLEQLISKFLAAQAGSNKSTS